jgi:hypothetical protein
VNDEDLCRSEQVPRSTLLCRSFQNPSAGSFH